MRVLNCFRHLKWVFMSSFACFVFAFVNMALVNEAIACSMNNVTFNGMSLFTFQIDNISSIYLTFSRRMVFERFGLKFVILLNFPIKILAKSDCHFSTHGCFTCFIEVVFFSGLLGWGIPLHNKICMFASSSSCHPPGVRLPRTQHSKLQFHNLRWLKTVPSTFQDVDFDVSL